jgi:hypothetical protein
MCLTKDHAIDCTFLPSFAGIVESLPWGQFKIFWKSGFQLIGMILFLNVRCSSVCVHPPSISDRFSYCAGPCGGSGYFPSTDIAGISMNLSHLATVEMQLIMHFLDHASLLALARCSRFTLACASADFAWQSLSPLPVLVRPDLNSLLEHSLIRFVDLAA